MNLRIDLRDKNIGDFNQATAVFPANTTFLATAWQWSAWKNPAPDIASRMLIMVPDFLYYARLASTGRAREIIRLPASLKGLLRSGLSCIPTGITQFPGLVRGDFWAAAEAMLAYDLGLLERDFAGEIILHYNLADFAWSFEKQSFIAAYNNKAKDRAGWGIATQQLPAALSACSRWSVAPSRIMYTTGISRPESLLIETVQTRQFDKTKWTVDMTQWPTEILQDNDLFDFHRPADNEWLVTYETGIKLLSI